VAPKSAKEHLRDAADLTGLPPEILLSIAKVESAFQTNARSPKGAIGVMQLMPETARALNVNPHDTRENIEGGARLLRDLLVKYEQYPDQVYRALSAYNAGPGAVAKYNGIPPYAETRAYVEKVLNEYHRLKTQKPDSR
jgi:soluble lytic murein transglycosylase-like protein